MLKCVFNGNLSNFIAFAEVEGKGGDRVTHRNDAVHETIAPFRLSSDIFALFLSHFLLCFGPNYCTARASMSINYNQIHIVGPIYRASGYVR